MINIISFFLGFFIAFLIFESSIFIHGPNGGIIKSLIFEHNKKKYKFETTIL